MTGANLYLMFFRDQDQLNRACAILAAGIGCPQAWTVKGPLSWNDLTTLYGPLSDGQRVVLQVCFDMFNGSGRAVFSDLLSKVDKPNIKRVSSLLAALGDGTFAVDRWINNRITSLPKTEGQVS